MNSVVRILLCFSTVFLTILPLSGCGKHAEPKQDSEVRCSSLARDAGGLIEYPDPVNSKKKKTISRFREYKTAAGFKMRIPAGTGGLGHPNMQCEVDEGEFEFFWVDGKLLPSVDWTRGQNRTEGTRIKYFVRFVRSNGANMEIPSWKLTDAFELPGYENVMVLPFGNLVSPDFLPMDRHDTSRWSPALLLEDAKNYKGLPTIFACDYLHISKVGREIKVDQRYKDASTSCSGFASFANGAGGRIDISSSDFLRNAPAIVHAVVQETSSYIVKE